MRLTSLVVCLLGLICTASAWPFYMPNWKPQNTNPYYNPNAYGYNYGYGRIPWYQMFYKYFYNNYNNNYNNNNGAPPSPQDCDCAPKSISLDEKLRLIGKDNDHNNDGVVNSADAIYDVSNNYDTNKDGVWTDEECVKRWTCAYGDYTPTATFICALIMQGEPNITISAFNNIPSFGAGIPLNAFLQMNRERYTRFNSQKCPNRCLTIEQKLVLDARNNDFNNDGIVKVADIYYDIAERYDTDKDGMMTKAEFVANWVCNYADTQDYARYFYKKNFFDKPSVDLNNLPFGEPFITGLPINEFKNRNRQNYENYYRDHPKPDCVDAYTNQGWVG